MRTYTTTHTTPAGFRSVRRYSALRLLVAGLALLVVAATQMLIGTDLTHAGAGFAIQSLLAVIGAAMVVTGTVRYRRL